MVRYLSNMQLHDPGSSSSSFPDRAPWCSESFSSAFPGRAPWCRQPLQCFLVPRTRALVGETRIDTRFRLGKGYSGSAEQVVQLVNLSPNIVYRVGDFQKAMEGVPRFAGISFWEPNWKLPGSVWGIRRTRFQPTRFQRRACELGWCR